MVEVAGLCRLGPRNRLRCGVRPRDEDEARPRQEPLDQRSVIVDVAACARVELAEEVGQHAHVSLQANTPLSVVPASSTRSRYSVAVAMPQFRRLVASVSA